MRIFFLSLFTICFISARATTYYISFSTGNDANNGTSTNTPWKTISKLNSAFASLQPGDNVLFNRGDVFYGSIVINKSGTSSSPITISSYGTGANPVISGFTSISSWTSAGTNLWQANTGSTLSTCNMLSINGVNTGMGRTPNANATNPYFNIDSYNGTSHTVTSSSLTSNWANAQIVIREGYSSESKYLVASQSGTTITYSQINQSLGTPLATGFGFFIQNNLNTLDQQGEWYYNGSSHSITIYSTSSPTGVNVSTVTNLLSDSRFNFILVDGIDFNGANNDAIYLTGGNNVTIKNSNISFCGGNGLETSGGTPDSLYNSTVTNVSNAGLFIVSDNMYIHNNNVTNVGIVHGQSDWSNRCSGIFTASGNKNQDIQYNVVKNIGACGIVVSPYSVVKYNSVDSTVLALTDFGGIYTAGNYQIWDHNIITNTLGYPLGTNRPNTKYAEGLYLDEGAASNVLINNSISNSGDAGLKLHSRSSGSANSNSNRIENNTFFNNTDAQIIIENDNGSLQMLADTVRYNICASYATSQLTLFLDDQHNTISSVGVFDYNYYMRPLDDLGSGKSIQGQTTSGYAQYNLPSWRTYSGYDIHSSASPMAISNASDMIFRYNNTNSPVTVSLPYNYMDAKNVNYNGAITLQPYSSAVLIKNGTILLNKLPKANAGADQIITLPTSLALLTGSGSDSDGTIASYNWKKISGPAAGTITDTTAASTIANGLVQGVYKFVLTVTDNLGGTGKDTMQVTVNPAANVPPLVNAGPDQTITLPTNTANLSGGATDPDGTIASYAWTKISGPSTYTIANASIAITTVTGLVKGTYQFELKATDNSGASTRDTMQVTVNPAPNVPPVANAGQAQTITLPTNTVTLSGSGTDADGTVVSYNWTEISGPATFTIVNGSSASTSVTGLVAGIYQFQLLVTDNSGATGTDIVQVTVNTATNIPPVANAGTDQSINLPTNSVTLSGSGTDADGTVVGYQWVEVSGPSAYTIVNASSAVTSITGLVQGTYQFQLTVTDNSNATSIDVVQVVVNASTNIPPVANAGTNQSIILPTNTVTLSGTGTDADGTIATYLWTKISGPSSYNIVSTSSPSTSVSGLVKGTYQFQLSVTDNSGAVSTDIVQIRVNNGTNIPPVSNAGTDQAITLPTNTVALSGSGTDADGTIASYLWTEISGPSVYSITNASSASTSVTGLVQGTYQFQLVVTDNKGATATDVMQIVVNGSVNIPPVANAGSGQSITLPTNTITLSGSGTDADGTVTAYQWTVISGPSTYNISNASSAITSVIGLVAGVYQFQLTVTDNNGATSTDIAQVTVNAAANIPPVANAGTNQTITLPANSVTLSGSGTDADGTVVSYQWAEISGPSAYSIANASSAITDITGLTAGTYQFQLLVTDNNGATGNAIVQIIVNAAANIPPVANAGTNQTIILPVNTVTLSGSGTDADGTVASYFWTETSGPATYNITNASSATTDITGLVQGTYVFQLIVTDNNGATSSSSVQITVNAAGNIAPVANAGTDQVIALPTNTITLSGSGTDADGAVVSYAWTKISGPSAYNIVNTSSAITNVTGLVSGTYQFQLLVTDNTGATGNSIVKITVNAATNIPPFANAGADQIITLPTNAVTLSGSGTDVDGTVVSYFWTETSGPATYNITNASSAVTNITGLIEGTYVFQLIVTDNSGATSSASEQVTVNAAENIPPVANAGADQIITLPTNTITLSGSGTDADGAVVSYAWTKISGPSAYNITNASSANGTIIGLAQGTYQFALIVTDDDGATGSDTMQVIVNAGNIPPVANAGTDQTIVLPANNITLSGSGTDADGTVVGYIWTKISGPVSYSITSSTSASTSVTGLVQGIYQFTLTVTDNGGASSIDTMQVIVNPAANIPPVANAGTDQTITLPINSISLSGSGSDADGTVASYSWTMISGPSSYTITSATSAATSVTGLVQGVYQFQLQITDNNGAIATDIVQVTVNSAVNIPPVANAGTDQVITLPVNSISLSGSGTDADGTIVSYAWTKISGPSSYAFTSSTSAATSVTGLVQGVYKFRLKVTDNSGASSTDIMQVIVNAAVNIPPVADAGMDQIITLPVNNISLSGNGTDADGTIASYEWTKISGPSSYTITSATSANTSVTGLAQGVYQFQLKVTDNSGATATDIMVVTVNAAVNIPPVANAGTDQTITLSVNTVSLSGSGSDADGTIASYTWTEVSGPSSYTITSATSASTGVTGLVQGVYQFQLAVTDNSGAISTDIVQVTVNAAVNIPPVANAGTDQTITLPVNSIALSGSGTDADGTVASYLWTKVSGPLSYTITSATSAATSVTGLTQGVYQFQLKVTDNSGATSTDMMQVTVNAAANVPPVANAGTNQTITSPVSSISLTGSGTDADGTIAGYTWTKVSGPSSYTITSATSAATSVTGLVQGVYQFQLKVTDNMDGISTDMMQVTVNAAANVPPFANAGINQSITLPVNSVSLSGSGTDADGTIVGYSWTKISGSGSYTITSATSAATSVTGLTQGVYQFQLKVTDDSGATSTDVVQVTVNAAVNIPPVANAGTDQTITLPVSSISLTGSGTDADGTIASYAWTKISGPASSVIASASSASTNVTGLTEGVYQFQLKVTDNNGATTTDVMQVTVNPAADIPPVANAGANQSIALPTNTVTLTGSGTDADGTVVSYVWTKVSGPASYTITSASSAITNVTGLTLGVYQFQLQITDNNGVIGTSIIQVTVNAAPNVPPVANAGADQTITLPTNTVNLSGIGTDADGTVTTYRWTKISGPSAYIITNGSSAATGITALTQGVYQFELKVTDNSGAIGTDVVQITVKAVPNVPPVVNAGADQTITLPTNTVTLSGSATDADGTIASYIWTKISGPSSYTIQKITSASTSVTRLTAGIYKFELRASDNSGTITRDTMQVTVNSAPNVPPVANAGPDRVVILPVNTTVLSGSGTDADGTVVSYVWTKISGPSGGTIVNASSPVTNVTDLVQGVYKYQLKVTDNHGATSVDTMQVSVIKVNILPHADAGADQTITLPVNSITLTGSGSDADGTITAYSWNEISGPSGSIVNANDSVTSVNNLTGGTYQFELTVTDNLGGVGKDTVTIVVAEPRLNLDPPTTNAANVYPNPVTDVTTLEITTAQAATSVKYVVSNILGRVMSQTTLAPELTDMKVPINMTNFAKGMYTVTVYFDNKQKQSIKVIKL